MANKQKSNFGNVYAELNLVKGLKVRTTLGGDFSFEKDKLFKEYLSDAIYNPTSLNEGRVFNQNLIWNSTATYDKSSENTKFLLC